VNNKTKITVLNYFIAGVWLINGLFAKILNLAPRHEAIVGNVLSEEYSRILIVLIGLAEIVMAIWVLSRLFPKINAVTQIIVIGTMNVLEFILTPDLLLWGHLNSLFALLFILIIYYKAFVLEPKKP